MAKITPIDVVKGHQRKGRQQSNRQLRHQQEMQQEFSNKRINKSSPICDSTRAPTRKNE